MLQLTSIGRFGITWFIRFSFIFKFWGNWFLLGSWHWRVFLTSFRKCFAGIIWCYFLLLCFKSWFLFSLFYNGWFFFLFLLLFVFYLRGGRVELLNNVIGKIKKLLIALDLLLAVFQILIHLFVHLPQFLGLGGFINRYFGLNLKQKNKIHPFSIWKFESFPPGAILHQSRLFAQSLHSPFINFQNLNFNLLLNIDLALPQLIDVLIPILKNIVNKEDIIIGMITKFNSYFLTRQRSTLFFYNSEFFVMWTSK